MTPTAPAFDDSQSTVTTVTLPVLLPAEGGQALKATVKQTLEHLGWLQYQAFLQALEAHWPAGVESLCAQDGGIGILSIRVRFSDALEREAAEMGRVNAFDDQKWSARHFELIPLSQFFHVLQVHWDRGNRWITPSDLPSLLDAAMTPKIRARLLDYILPALPVAGSVFSILLL